MNKKISCQQLSNAVNWIKGQFYPLFNSGSKYYRIKKFNIGIQKFNTFLCMYMNISDKYAIIKCIL